MNSMELAEEIRSLKQDMIECESLLEKLNKIEQVHSVDLQFTGSDFKLYLHFNQPETDIIDVKLIKETVKNNLKRKLVNYLFKINNLSLSLD